MRIASLIAAYSITPDDLSRVTGLLPNVFVFSPDDSASRYGTHIHCDAGLQHNMVFQPRKWITEHLYEWDYFYYCEDDIVTRKEQIDFVIEFQNTLPGGCVSGFLRYERYGSERQFIDINPIHSIHCGGTGIVRSKQSYGWQPWNVHSGNFLLSGEQVIDLMKRNKWDTEFKQCGHSYCGILESGATSVYQILNKYLPYDYDKVAVEHIANKYNGPTDNELKQLL